MEALLAKIDSLYDLTDGNNSKLTPKMSNKSSSSPSSTSA